MMHWHLFFLICLLATSAIGCSSKSVTEAIDRAKEKATELSASTIEKVEEALPATGKLEIQGDEMIAASRASIQLHDVGDGRPRAVQILTYKPGPNVGHFPAVCVHGVTDASSLGDLVGKRVPCELFIQTQPNGVISMATFEQPIDVQFGSIDPSTQIMSVTINSGLLHRSDGSTMKINGGSVEALLKEAGQ
ncbi:MAG: hypothetical protein AAF664_21350 [Planctomycetota bacterium]